MDFIHFHSFSRILLLIWKYPSGENFPYDQALPFLETLNHLEVQKIANAKESFDRCLKIAFNQHISQNHRETLQCLIIPCCFLLGISDSRDSSLQKSIDTRLERILSNTRLNFDTSPCAAFIYLTSKFLEKLLKICGNPVKEVKNCDRNLDYVKSTKYISERGKIFFELYMAEYLVDCSTYYHVHDYARFYKSQHECLVKRVHEKLREHAGEQENPSASSAEKN